MTRETELDFNDSENTELDMDGDDMFADLDFDELEGGANPKDNDRNPIARAFSGFTSGFTAEVQKPSMVDTALSNALPANMSEVHTNVKEFNKNVDKTMKKAVRQHGYTLKDTLTAAGHEGAADSFIERYTEEREEDNEERVKSEGELRDDLLNGIFAASAEAESTRIEVDQARDNLADAKDTKRHEHSTVLQSQQLDHLKNLNSFNRDITFKYQRANLETNLKSYAIQRSVLKITKEFNEAQLTALKAITLNTSLPEVNKIQASEKLAASLSSKLTDGIADGFTDNGGLAKLVGKMSSDKMNAGINKVFGWKSNYDQMMSAGNPIDLLSESVGAMAAEGAIGGAGTLVANSKILENVKVANAMATADMGIDTFKSDMMHRATKLTTDRSSDGGVKSLLRGIGRMILPAGAGETGLAGISLKPDSYLQKHHLAQTDVIPQLLAKILMNVITIRTGRQPKELEFDYTTLRFRKKMVNTFDPMSKINNKFGRTGNQQKARVSADELLGDNGTAAERKVLARGLLATSIHARAGGKNVTSMREFYESDTFKGMSKAMRRKLKHRLEGKEVELYRAIRSLKSSTADPTATLKRLIKEHGHAPLMDAGILKMNATNTDLVLDEKKYLKWLTKDVGKFSNGIGGMISEDEMRATGKLGRLESYADVMAKEAAFKAGKLNEEGDTRHKREQDAQDAINGVVKKAKEEGTDVNTAIGERIHDDAESTVDAMLGVRRGLAHSIGEQMHKHAFDKGPAAVRRLVNKLKLHLPGNVKAYLARQHRAAAQMFKAKSQEEARNGNGDNNTTSTVKKIMHSIQKASANILPETKKLAVASANKVEEMARRQVNDVTGFLADGMGLDGISDTVSVHGKGTMTRMFKGMGTIRTGLSAAGDRIASMTKDPLSAFTGLLNKAAESKRLVLNLPTALGNTTEATEALSKATGKAQNLNYIFNTPSLTIDRVLQGVNSDEEQTAQEKLIEEEREARLRLAKEQAVREKRDVYVQRAKFAIAAYQLIEETHRHRGVARKIKRVLTRLKVPQKDRINDVNTVAEQIAAAQLGIAAAQYRAQVKTAYHIKRLARAQAGPHRSNGSGAWREGRARGRASDMLVNVLTTLVAPIASLAAGAVIFSTTAAAIALKKRHDEIVEQESFPDLQRKTELQRTTSADVKEFTLNRVAPVTNSLRALDHEFEDAFTGTKRFLQDINSWGSPGDFLRRREKQRKAEDDRKWNERIADYRKQVPNQVGRNLAIKKNKIKAAPTKQKMEWSMSRLRNYKKQLESPELADSDRWDPVMGVMVNSRKDDIIKQITHIRKNLNIQDKVLDKFRIQVKSKYIPSAKKNDSLYSMVTKYVSAKKSPERSKKFVGVKEKIKKYLDGRLKVLSPTNMAVAMVRYRQYGITDPSKWMTMFKFENYLIRSGFIVNSPTRFSIDMRRVNPMLLEVIFETEDPNKLHKIAKWFDTVFIHVLLLHFNALKGAHPDYKTLDMYSGLTGWQQRQYLRIIPYADLFSSENVLNPFTDEPLERQNTADMVPFRTAKAASKAKSVYDNNRGDPLVRNVQKKFGAMMVKSERGILKSKKFLEAASKKVNDSIKTVKDIKDSALETRDKLINMTEEKYNQVKNTKFPTRSEIEKGIDIAKEKVIETIDDTAAFSAKLGGRIYDTVLKGSNITRRDIQSIYHTLTPETRKKLRQLGRLGKATLDSLDEKTRAELEVAYKYMDKKATTLTTRLSNLLGVQYNKLSPSTRKEIKGLYDKGNVEFTRLSVSAQEELRRLKLAGTEALSEAAQLILKDTEDVRKRIGDNYEILSVMAKNNIIKLTTEGKLKWENLDVVVRNEISLRYNQSIGYVNKGIVMFNDLMSKLGDGYDELSKTAKAEIKAANRNGKINYDALTAATRSEIKRVIRTSKVRLRKTVRATSEFIQNNRMSYKDFKKLTSKEFEALSDSGQEMYNEGLKVYEMSPAAREEYLEKRYEETLNVLRDVGGNLKGEALALKKTTELYAKKKLIEVDMKTKAYRKKIAVAFHTSASALSEHISKYKLKFSKETRDEIKRLISKGSLTYDDLSKPAKNEVDKIWSYGKELFDSGVFRIGRLMVSITKLTDDTRNEVLDMFDNKDLRFDKLTMKAREELAKVFDEGKTKVGKMSPDEYMAKLVSKLKKGMESAPLVTQTIQQLADARREKEKSARAYLGKMKKKVDDKYKDLEAGISTTLKKARDKTVDSEWAAMSAAERKEAIAHRKRTLELTRSDYAQAKQILLDKKKESHDKYLVAKADATAFVGSPVSKQLQIDAAEDIKWNGVKAYRKSMKGLDKLARKERADQLALEAEKSRSNGLASYSLAHKKAQKAYDLVDKSARGKGYEEGSPIPVVAEGQRFSVDAMRRLRSGGEQAYTSIPELAKKLKDSLPDLLDKAKKEAPELYDKAKAGASGLIDKAKVEINKPNGIVNNIIVAGNSTVKDVVKQYNDAKAVVDAKGGELKQGLGPLLDKINPDGAKKLLNEAGDTYEDKKADVKDAMDKAGDVYDAKKAEVKTLLNRAASTYKTKSELVVANAKVVMDSASRVTADKSTKLLQVQATMLSSVSMLIEDATTAAASLLNVDRDKLTKNKLPPPPPGLYTPGAGSSNATGGGGRHGPFLPTVSNGRMGPQPYIGGQGRHGPNLPKSYYGPQQPQPASKQVSNRRSEITQAANSEHRPPGDMALIDEETSKFKERKASPEETLRAIRAVDAASAATGLDPVLLRNVCYVESRLDPLAKAKASTARGLFQFVVETWDESYGKWAEEYGFIGKTVYNPEANAMFGALYIKRDMKRVMRAKGGSSLTEGEMYSILFLGGGGASSLARAARNTPNHDAVLKFEDAAGANPSVFHVWAPSHVPYSKRAHRTCAQVVAELQRRATMGNNTNWVHAYYPPQKGEEGYQDPEGKMGPSANDTVDKVEASRSHSNHSIDGPVIPKAYNSSAQGPVVPHARGKLKDGQVVASTSLSGPSPTPVSIKPGLGGQATPAANKAVSGGAGTVEQGGGMITGLMSQLVGFAKETNEHLKSINFNSAQPTKVEVDLNQMGPGADLEASGKVADKTNIPFTNKKRSPLNVKLSNEESFGAKTPTIK